MKDAKDVSCLLLDSGLFLPWATRLTREFKRVVYAPHWRGPYTRSRKLIIGAGFPEFEQTLEPFELLRKKEIDLVVTPDVQEGDIAEFLRSVGVPVWGSGAAGELETNRFKLKQALASVGLPVAPYKKIRGFDSLRAYLKEHDNQIVKLSVAKGSNRGDSESWKHTRYEASELRLDQLGYVLGAAKPITIFIVEDMIDSDCEIGYDGYMVNGRFPAIAGYGPEIKDTGYAGVLKPAKEHPKCLRDANERLQPVFEKYNYRGWYSNELRIAKDGTPYYLDATCRSPSPPSETYQELIGNWGEIVWAGAQGEMVRPQPVAKYGVQAMIKSAWANKDFTACFVKPSAKPWVKLMNACQIDDTIHVVPINEDLIEIGSVVGIGDSLDEAIRQCQKHAKGFEGYQAEVSLDALDDAKTQIQAMKKYKMDF